MWNNRHSDDTDSLVKNIDTTAFSNPRLPQIHLMAITMNDNLETRLAQFRDNRTKWLSWLGEDEHHAIRGQIASMMWNDAVFRVLNEARTPVDGDPVSATNGVLGRFINQGYKSTQILAICKLVDSREDVISLLRLLKDMRTFRPNLTRELYVYQEGQPYDSDTDCPLHEAFDRLSGVTRDHRTRDDVMMETIFDSLDKLLKDDAIVKIKNLRNKFFAHAADQNSRNKASVESLHLPFEMVSKAHRAIIFIFCAIDSIYFRTCHWGMIPYMPPDFFNGLDRPYASKSSFQNLGQLWATHSKEREKWCDDWRGELGI